MLDLLVLSTFIFIRQIILCICYVKKNIFTQRQEGLTAVSFFLEKYFIKYQIHCILMMLELSYRYYNTAVQRFCL